MEKFTKFTLEDYYKTMEELKITTEEGTQSDLLDAEKFVYLTVGESRNE